MFLVFNGMKWVVCMKHLRMHPELGAEKASFVMKHHFNLKND